MKQEDLSAIDIDEIVLLPFDWSFLLGSKAVEEVVQMRMHTCSHTVGMFIVRSDFDTGRLSIAD